MSKLKITMAACAAAFLAASPASAAVIDFDDLADGDVVTNQIPGVTFSSQAGSEVLVTAQNLGTSTPNFICSGTNGSINCVDDVYLDFDTAVSNLSFFAVGDNNMGDIGDVRVFGGGGLLGTVDIFGDGNGFSPILVDLAAFSGVTRIEIANITDLAGLGYDDFSFVVGGGAVPEPSTWALMILGFGAVGASMRNSSKRRRKFTAAAA